MTNILEVSKIFEDMIDKATTPKNLSDFEGSDRGYLLSKEDTIIERNIDFFYKGKAFNLTIREE